MYKSLGFSSDMSEKTAIILCKRMAAEIEASMWVMFNESWSGEYKNKFRSLIYNLQDPRNNELRLAILAGDIKPSELPKMDSMQLAPNELKQMRDARESKYFKEQVLLEADAASARIITKSHKGETVISSMDIEDVIKAQKVEQRKEIEKETKKEEKVDNDKSMTEGDEDAWSNEEAEEVKTPASKREVTSPTKKQAEVKKRENKETEATVEFYLSRLGNRYRSMIGGELGERMARELVQIAEDQKKVGK